MTVDHSNMVMKVERPSEDVKNICLKQCFKYQTENNEQLGSDLMDEIQRQQHQQPPSASEGGSYECRFCRKPFTTDSRLKRHSHTVHSSERRFFCSICRTGFTRHEHLKRHVLCHYNERPYQCDLCPKSFARKEYLKRHLFIHSGETPISCEYCDRKFYRKDHLVKHQNRIHKKQPNEPG